MSRLLSDLTGPMQTKYKAFKKAMDAAGLAFVVTCTYRSQEEQDALFEQGRTKPGKIVTWTHHSRHTQRDAFDIAMFKNGQIDWSNIAVYIKAGEIGEACGLTWGGRFKDAKGRPRPDYPHFQND